eukprot:364797-Chlamydomonas_euryale.AAC.6
MPRQVSNITQQLRSEVRTLGDETARLKAHAVESAEAAKREAERATAADAAAGDARAELARVRSSHDAALAAAVAAGETQVAALRTQLEAARKERNTLQVRGTCCRCAERAAGERNVLQVSGTCCRCAERAAGERNALQACGMCRKCSRQPQAPEGIAANRTAHRLAHCVVPTCGDCAAAGLDASLRRCISRCIGCPTLPPR